MKNRLFAASLFCALSPTAPAVETQVLLYNAFSEAPAQLTLAPQESLTGECLTHSKLSPREDAWRCISGNRLFDPCYVRTYVKRNEVICPLAPWKVAGTVLTIGRELPQPFVAINAYSQVPWAVELMSGKTCLQINENGKIQYRCDSYGIVEATVHRCKGLWNFIVQSPNEVFTQTEQIAKAYY